MKRLTIMGLALFVTLSVCTPVLPGERGTDLDKLMLTEYPNWWSMDKEVRETIERMFINSPNKHWWFPDKYPAKEVYHATMRPKKR